MQYRINYRGEGEVQVHKERFGGADFEQTRPSREDPTRTTTEYIPGWAGLTFNRAKWEAFVNGGEESVTLKHPDWTCTDYDNYLKEKASQPPEVVKPGNNL